MTVPACTREIGPFIKAYVFPLAYNSAGAGYMWIGDNDGNVFAAGDYNRMMSTDYNADNTYSISAWWRSKRLDFSDQYPEVGNRFKTIDRVQLEYIDHDADTPVTIFISSDGGVTWVSVTRLLGTGNEKQKSADFYFADKEEITGKYFNVKILSASASTRFTWTGIYLWFEPRGEYFEV